MISLDTAEATTRTVATDALEAAEDSDATELIGTDDTVTENTIEFVAKMRNGVRRAFSGLLEGDRLMALQDARGRTVWQGGLWNPEHIDQFSLQDAEAINAAYRKALVEQRQAAQTAGTTE